MNRFRLWLARFFSPHGHMVVEAKPKEPTKLEFTVTSDASQAMAELAALEAQLVRVRDLTPAALRDLDIRRIECGPTDTILVETDQRLSGEATAHIREGIREAFGPGRRVLVAESGLKIRILGEQPTDDSKPREA
jgi:hypothetical protein